MIPVGIDTLAIYTPRYALDLKTLAKARGYDDAHYVSQLGQEMMAVPPPGEDIVTMAANAAQEVIHDVDPHTIAMLLFATESGIDQSKAAGIYVHDLLHLPSQCRVVELKQACYSGTAALQLSLSFLHQHPDKKVLLVMSDIARYGLKTTGESSQGAGACALLLSMHPRLITIDPEYGVVTQNEMDFWRPNYLDEALVEGKYSSKLYLSMLEKCWQSYLALSRRPIESHVYVCYHTPIPRLVETAHHHLLKFNRTILHREESTKQVAASLLYPRQMGNSYTAALYIAFSSLLDHVPSLSEKRIGFYSYGSGCVAEFFSGVIQPTYQAALHSAAHKMLFSNRQLLTSEDYEMFYNFRYPQDGSLHIMPVYDTGHFRLTRFENHKRIYEEVK